MSSKDRQLTGHQFEIMLKENTEDLVITSISFNQTTGNQPGIEQISIKETINGKEAGPSLKELGNQELNKLKVETLKKNIEAVKESIEALKGNSNVKKEEAKNENTQALQDRNQILVDKGRHEALQNLCREKDKIIQYQLHLISNLKRENNHLK